ncbi:putative integral membrane protein [Rosellinia necatrix]|uniref:Putative integral membrane protein n=1 Tax=Rosellinia necatrix TaxID=77044 RepID=A0A1W2TDP9_ROSNE|nr:putative integral membrane protein [Rosellinia necatrix]
MASTTIVPFASLPSCAADCGALYDANGACVPPVNPSTDESSWNSCFCAFGTLQPLKSGPNDVCVGTCNSDPQGLAGIQSWFTSFCNVVAAPTTSTGAPTSSSTAVKGNNNQGGGDWVSTHTQWIVFIVVVVVAIIGIWTGACIWRRKYLKKKNRLYELGKGLPSTVAVNTQGNLVGSGARDSTFSDGHGLFMSGPGGAGLEQPGEHRSRWGRR